MVYEINLGNGTIAILSGKEGKKQTLVFDKSHPVLGSYILSQLDKIRLYETIDHTTTAVGYATHFHSLAAPTTSLDEIVAKQDAVKEIESDPQLRDMLTKYINNFSKHESKIFEFMGTPLNHITKYKLFSDIRKIGRDIGRGLPVPKTDYLRNQVNGIVGFEQTELHEMMGGPIYWTFKGIKPKRKRISNGIRYFTTYNIPTIATSTSLAGLLVGLETGLIELSPNIAYTGLGMLAGIGAAFLYDVGIKPIIDHCAILRPFKKQMISKEGFIPVLSAVGKIDELLSIVKYKESSDVPMAMPKMTKPKTHSFQAKGMRHPILAAENTDVVANNFYLERGLTFITGPRGSGASTTLETIAYNQMLAQAGCYVPATSAEIAVADKLFYQKSISGKAISNYERFANEAKKTKSIFEIATPRSLVLLDSLSEGVTYEEKREYLRTVLEKLNLIGNNTVVVTHDLGLVEEFQREGIGKFLRLGISENKPTYKLTGGISDARYTAGILQEIGFTEADMMSSLRKRGYI